MKYGHVDGPLRKVRGFQGKLTGLRKISKGPSFEKHFSMMTYNDQWGYNYFRASICHHQFGFMVA